MKGYNQETWKILDTNQEKTFFMDERTGNIIALTSFEEKDGKKYQINENFNVVDKGLKRRINLKTIYEVKREESMPISLTATDIANPDKILKFRDLEKLNERKKIKQRRILLKTSRYSDGN